MKDPNIMLWASIVKEQSKIISEDVDEKDILENIFSSILIFMQGKGDKILKDSEWMNYLINDLNAAVRKGLWTPNVEDKRALDKLNTANEE